MRGRGRGGLALSLLLLVAVPGCRGLEHGDVDGVDAPTTPEAQLDALSAAAQAAEATGQWARVEVITTVLCRVRPNDSALASRLHEVRRRRQVNDVLDEAQTLLEVGAWYSARQRLAPLEVRGALHAVDRTRLETLMAWALRERDAAADQGVQAGGRTSDLPGGGAEDLTTPELEPSEQAIPDVR